MTLQQWNTLLLTVLVAVSWLMLAAQPLFPLSLKTAAAEVWREDAAWPELTARNETAPGAKYFSGNEWTGARGSKDAGGNRVNQADIFGVNREPAHATDTVPYDTVEHAVEGAKDGEITHSEWVQMLTGAGQPWDLTVYKNLNQATMVGVTDNFYKTDFTGVAKNPYTGKGTVGAYPTADYGCGWRSVILPASWQTQGFDFPIYTNINTPWRGTYGNAGGEDKSMTPLAPTVTNPVGFYRRTFDVPADWMASGRKVYISFQGVESAMYLYVNGNEVGYTEDSYDAHDFDITPFLNADGKDNLLAVRVHRWCDGSWLEDQDVLRMAGIFRDVFLYSEPAVFIRDYKVETDLDDTFTDATLNLNIEIANRSTAEAKGFAVDVKLYDAEGVDLFAGEPLRSELSAVESGANGTLTLNRLVKAPRLWSDEDPYLYTMVISLYDTVSGKRFVSVSQPLGFREITFTKSVVDKNYNNITETYQTILLNGKPLQFRGVNRHDNNPLTGKYVPHDLYETDIRIMKENNINAVRTSHYPDDRYLYYLCDKYGILVMAETNAESHALQHDSDTMAAHFTKAYRDRLTSNVQAQKNRASVVMWSLGNECGDTSGSKMFQKAIQEVLRPLDSTRPVHYEGLQNNGGVDVYSNMYPTVETVGAQGTLKNHMPYVLCEYVFSQGNSTGNLKEYWDQIRKYDNMLGAFVWDYVDKTVATPLPANQRMVLSVDKSKTGATATLKGTMGDSTLWGKELKEGYAVVKTSAALNQALSGKHPFTLEMQVCPHGSGEYQQLLSKSDHQVSLRVFSDSRLDLVLYSGGDWQVNEFSLPANWKNNWHHVVCCFDGTKVTMFCDGKSVNCQHPVALKGGIPESDYDIAVNYDTETGRTGDNEVAYARVYDRVLTTAEMTAQDAADRGKGSYAIPADDESVLLWMDFAHFTEADYHPDDTALWDYYAEAGNSDLAGMYLGYGGDWGEEMHDGSYMCDGLISSDRTVQPEMQEVAYVYQPVWFEAKDLAAHTVTVKNEHRFLNTSKFVCEWELLEDGKVLQSGKLDTAVAPLSSDTVTVPFTLPDTPAAGGEYFLNLRMVLREATNCLPQGHCIAYEQFALPADTEKVAAVNPVTLPRLTKTSENGVLTVKGNDFTVTFSETTGLLTSFVYGGETLLTEGPRPNYWRAAMDSDHQSSGWRVAGNGRTLSAFSVSETAGAVTVKVVWTMPQAGNSRQTYIYTVYGNGAIHVATTLSPSSASGELLKVGAELTLPREFEQITFYGEGPEDAFVDRRQGAKVGLYETTVSDSFFPFVRPQTSGNHTGVRYMALTAEGKKTGLAVVGDKPIEASALHYRVTDYSGCAHPYDMPKTDYTILNVDAVSAGLGGANCGPGTRSEYRVYPNHVYEYAYTLLPFDAAEDDVMELSKAWRADTKGAPAAGALGDVDGDSDVTTTDARLTLQYAAGKIGEDALDLSAADVDGKDAVTTTDARLILQKAAGKIEDFPVS